MSTKAQAKTQVKTPAAPAAARIPQHPVAVPEHEVERPDIAAQLEGAARLGHSLGAVGVVSPAPPIIQRQEMPEEEEEELQLKREPAAVQRQEQPEEEEEELMLKPDVQRVGAEGSPVAPEVEAAIQRTRGGGQPLESALQVHMSEALGHDFSGVRVHADSEADALNQQLSAKAFTTGPDIFFKRGAYDPGSSGGRELIAHELTHVVQQSTGRVRGDGSGIIVRPAADDFEQEANRLAGKATDTSMSGRIPDPLQSRRYQKTLETLKASPSNILPIYNGQLQPGYSRGTAMLMRAYNRPTGKERSGQTVQRAAIGRRDLGPGSHLPHGHRPPKQPKKKTERTRAGEKEKVFVSEGVRKDLLKATKGFYHAHIWFDDTGLRTTNVGFGPTPPHKFYGPPELFSEDGRKVEYTMDYTGMDDDVMRVAVAEVGVPRRNYNLLGYNCQAWVNEVHRHYPEIAKQKFQSTPSEWDQLVSNALRNPLWNSIKKR